MNRIITLVLIGGITFLLILFLNRPDLLNDIWLWLIGLSGGIIQAVKSGIEFLRKGETENKKPILTTQSASNSGAAVKDSSIQFKKVAKTIQKPILKPPKVRISVKEPIPKLPSTIKKRQGNFDGLTITVLRCFDDEQTTIGWLYLDDDYHCFTLEDTYREVKIRGETRIQAGTYKLDFNKSLTDKTKKYKEKYPDWFSYHLHIKNVPNFEGIYIHNGGDHKDTLGCLLVSDSLVMQEKQTYFNNSTNTFKNLYIKLRKILEANTPVRIIIMNEDWVDKLNMMP